MEGTAIPFQNAIPGLYPPKNSEHRIWVATCSSLVTRPLTRGFERRADIYFRFSVNHGAGLIPLKEWKKVGDVQTHTYPFARCKGTFLARNLNFQPQHLLLSSFQ